MYTAPFFNVASMEEKLYSQSAAVVESGDKLLIGCSDLDLVPAVHGDDLLYNGEWGKGGGCE